MLPGLGFAQFTLLSPFDYVTKYIRIFFVLFFVFHLTQLSNVTGDK